MVVKGNSLPQFGSGSYCQDIKRYVIKYLTHAGIINVLADMSTFWPHL